MDEKIDKINKQEQIDKWSKLYSRQISEEEYKQIHNNLNGFFELLNKWDKKYK